MNMLTLARRASEGLVLRGVRPLLARRANKLPILALSFSGFPPER